MKTKSTPGPWRVANFKNDDLRVISESTHVASIHHTELRIASGHLESERREANAALIAAAPSLLEACKAVAHAAEDFIALLKRRKQTTKAKWKSAGGEMGHALGLAEAAIADAEGKAE